MGTIAFYHLIPILRAGGPTRCRISLNRRSVELTRIDRHTDKIRWKGHPVLIGGRKGDALIVLKNYDELHYPMERLLSTFSTNSKLCTKLSSPEALDTVLAILEPT